MPMTRRGTVLARRTRRSSRRASTGDAADDDRVEEDAELAFLLLAPRRPSWRSPVRRDDGPTRRPGWRTAFRPASRTSSSACSQLVLNPMPKPASTSCDLRAHDPRQQDVADPVVDRVRPVDPALLDEHGLASRACAATAATWRVWFDWTPPIDTRCVAPWASASGTRYSSLRVLLPPKASPELQSSRLAQIVAPPRWRLRRSSWWTGLGPNRSG